MWGTSPNSLLARLRSADTTHKHAPQSRHLVVCPNYSSWHLHCVVVFHFHDWRHFSKIPHQPLTVPCRKVDPMFRAPRREDVYGGLLGRFLPPMAVNSGPHTLACQCADWLPDRAALLAPSSVPTGTVGLQFCSQSSDHWRNMDPIRGRSETNCFYEINGPNWKINEERIGVEVLSSFLSLNNFWLQFRHTLVLSFWRDRASRISRVTFEHVCHLCETSSFDDSTNMTVLYDVAS
jgi:hypothetical protein